MEPMATDLMAKIADMDSVDGKMKEALQQTLDDTDLGRRVMDLLSGGLNAQGVEIANLKEELQKTSVRLADTTTTLSAWTHSQRQTEAALQKVESSFATLQMELLKDRGAALPSAPPGMPSPVTPIPWSCHV